MSNFTPLTKTFNPSWYFNTEFGVGGARTPLAASDKTFIIGYYVGAREQEFDGKSTIIHTIKITEVGNEKQLKVNDGETVKKFDDVDFFGSAMSNDILSKVEKGTLIRIMWTGKEAVKKNPSKSYNVFEIGADASAEKFNFGTGQVGGETVAAPSTEAPSQGITSDDASDDWDNDDDDFPA